jgi:hypothetical protein
MQSFIETVSLSLSLSLAALVCPFNRSTTICRRKRIISFHLLIMRGHLERVSWFDSAQPNERHLRSARFSSSIATAVVRSQFDCGSFGHANQCSPFDCNHSSSLPFPIHYEPFELHLCRSLSHIVRIIRWASSSIRLFAGSAALLAQFRRRIEPDKLVEPNQTEPQSTDRERMQTHNRHFEPLHSLFLSFAESRNCASEQFKFIRRCESNWQARAGVTCAI